MTRAAEINWKAAKCLALVPWLRSKGEIPQETLDEDAAVDMMDWENSKIDDLLTEAEIEAPEPREGPIGISLPSMDIANGFAHWLDAKDTLVFEAALVFDKEGKTLLWHTPMAGSAYIPDSMDLWEFLKANPKIIGGVAHTHPWKGSAWYSRTDVTTFSAIERGLGVKWIWPVVTFSEVRSYEKNGPGLWDYGVCTLDLPVEVDELRRKSKGG